MWRRNVKGMSTRLITKWCKVLEITSIFLLRIRGLQPTYTKQRYQQRPKSPYWMHFFVLGGQEGALVPFLPWVVGSHLNCIIWSHVLLASAAGVYPPVSGHSGPGIHVSVASRIPEQSASSSMILTEGLPEGSLLSRSCQIWQMVAKG